MLPALKDLDPTNLSTVHEAMNGSLRGHNYAKSSIDIACWDILGKATNQDVATLLGGRVQESFPFTRQFPWALPMRCSSMCSTVVPKAFTVSSQKLAQIPMKMRNGSARWSVTTADDIIVADANGGWRIQDAIIAARLIEPLHGVFFEEPCKSLEECLYVRQRTSLPMILDEVITDVNTMVRASNEQGMEGVNLKIFKFSGLSGSKPVRDLADSLGLRVTIEDTWGGDVVTAAVSHLAASTKTGPGDRRVIH